MQRHNGFTLLEVLVALAVLAIALAAIIKASGQHTDNLLYLRDKTFAHWVALNVINRIQISKTFPQTGKRHGTEVMGEHKWYWQMQTSETLDPKLHKLDVFVYRNEDDNIAVTRLTAYVGASF